VDRRRRWHANRPPEEDLLTFILLALLVSLRSVFFTLSRSKLPGYILPAFPSICLMAARACVTLTSAHRKSFRFSLITAAVFLFLLLALVRMVTPHISFGNEKFGGIAGLIIVLIGLANVFLGIIYPSCSRTDLRKLLAASSVVPILLAVSLADGLLSSYFRWDPSGRSLSEEIRRNGIPSQELRARAMSRGLRYSLSFYVHNEVTEWEAEHPREGYLLSGGRYCRGIVGSDLTCEENPIQFGEDWFLSIPRRTAISGQPCQQRATSLKRTTQSYSHTRACPHPPSSQNSHAQ